MKESFMEHFKSVIESSGTSKDFANAVNHFNSKPKKLMIKNFKDLPPLPNNFKELNWEKLETAVNMAFNEPDYIFRSQELYKCCETLCRQGYAPFVHKNMKDLFKRQVESKLSLFQNQVKDKMEFVIKVQSSWEEYINKMNQIRSIFIFLDQYYALPTPGVSSIWDMGINIFKIKIKEDETISSSTISIVLNLIQKERDGNQVDTELVQKLLKMLHDLEKYDEDFQRKLLTQAKEYYNLESQTKLKSNNLNYNLELIEKKLVSETERARKYLSKNTLQPLLNIIYENMVLNKADILLGMDFSEALLESKHNVLARIFRLFKDANALVPLNNKFYEIIMRAGTEAIADPEKDKLMIENILEYREKISKITTEDFQNPVEFQRSLIRAFEDFMATRGTVPAKLLAKALDGVLRSGNLKLSDDEVDLKLDKLFSLFRFIQGKDIFEAFYKQSLAKRLLLNRSASYDNERFMILKLRGEIGSEYTEKLDGMFKDIEVSDEITKRYEDKYSNLPNNFNISFNVLTQAYWPTYPPISVNLPNEMEIALNHFSKFYLEQHSGRRLFWQHSLSKAVLFGNFIKGRKELTVSLFQAVVLFLFNKGGPVGSGLGIAMKNIRELTGIDNDQLKLILASLCAPKTQLLLKSPKTKGFSDADIYTLNEGFNSPNYRVKVNSLQLKETVRGDNKIQEMVMHNRQFLIDAFIVRLMKSRRNARHVEIMSETLKGLKFPAEPPMIKSRIENLIEREFLERDLEEIDLLLYVA